MGRPLKIGCKHTKGENCTICAQKRDVDWARRWQALCLLRQGERLIRVKAVLGVMHTRIQQWVRWYEGGGIEEVARHQRGHRKRHRQAWTMEQEIKLRKAASEGRFRTIGEVVRWCREALGVEVSENKVYYWFRRWGCRKKGPRPLTERANIEAHEAWKKRAIGSPLAAGGAGGGVGMVCG